MTVDIGPPYSRKPQHLKQFMKEDKKNRHCVCKLVWLLISLLLLAVITFYLYHVIKTTIDDPVEFVMKPLPKGKMLYPPLKFCYGHWIHFVNFTKVAEMNFTKPELIVAASYIARAYSEHHFDVQAVEKSLQNKLRDGNLTLSQFFAKTAKNFEPFQSTYNHPSIRNVSLEHTVKLEQLSQDASESVAPYYAMCYVYSENRVKSAVEKFRSISGGKNFIRIDLDSLIPEKTHESMDWLTSSEYMAYTYDFNDRFMASNQIYKDIVGARFVSNNTTKEKIGAPFLIYPDAYSHNGILAIRKSTYTIHVKPGQVKKKLGCEKGSNLAVIGLLYKNPCNKTCVKNRQWISTNETCQKSHVTQKRVSEFASFFDHEWNDLYSIYQGPIYFLGSKLGTGIDTNLTFNGQFIPQSEVTNVNGSIGMDIKVTYGQNSPVEECEKEKGCELWSFDVRIRKTMLEDVPRLRIEYANEDDVIVTVENHLLTAENLAQSIGIFVGIWLLLCVSLLFQLFFTCCPKTC